MAIERTVRPSTLDGRQEDQRLVRPLPIVFAERCRLDAGAQGIQHKLVLEAGGLVRRAESDFLSRAALGTQTGRGGRLKLRRRLLDRRPVRLRRARLLGRGRSVGRLLQQNRAWLAGASGRAGFAAEACVVRRNPESTISPAQSSRNPAKTRMKTVLKLIIPFTLGRTANYAGWGLPHRSI